MKRILFIAHTLEVGGIETYLLRFLEHYKGKVEATVVCKSGRLGSLKSRYVNVCENVIPFPLGWVDLFAYVKLYFLLKRGSWEAVCDFSGDLSGLVLITAYAASVRKRIAFYRSSSHAFRPSVAKNFYAKIQNLFVRHAATQVLSNSQAALNRFHPKWRFSGSYYRIIDNGVSGYVRLSAQEISAKRAALGIEPDVFLIGHTGRLNPSKNHGQILNLASSLASGPHKVKFFLCGEGVKDGLLERVKNLDLRDSVYLDNSREDIWEILQCFDAFYFPSLREGQPNSLIEAMIVGLPFVASDIEEIREIVPDGLRRYLVPASDTAAARAQFESFVVSRANFPTNEVSAFAIRKFDAGLNFARFYELL
jgi:glycosyltransferase involved in cell wall biosynthesis